jgi:hypothetical protein
MTTNSIMFIHTYIHRYIDINLHTVHKIKFQDIYSHRLSLLLQVEPADSSEDEEFGMSEESARWLHPKSMKRSKTTLSGSQANSIYQRNSWSLSPEPLYMDISYASVYIYFIFTSQAWKIHMHYFIFSIIKL